MVRANSTDKRAENNRNRVRRYRHIRKMKTIHENKIRDEIYSNKIDSEILLNSTLQSDDGVRHCNDMASDVKNKIINWAIHHRIAKFALNDLLKILNFAGLSFLPRDSRTLLNTPVNVPIKELTNGHFWYNGIEQCLRNIFAELDRAVSLTLDFNFDGVPIFKSSNNQFWPILSSIRGMNFDINM